MVEEESSWRVGIIQEGQRIPLQRISVLIAMEKDFLGISGQNSNAFVMEQKFGDRFDSAFSVSSSVHWPFLNRTSHPLQKVISFETSVEDKPPFKASNTVCSVNVTEKKLCTNPTATAVKQQPFASTIASNSSLGKNVVGSFTPRNEQKAQMKNPQLTIFYAGSVNVYDDVPSHMAQTILLTASRECKTAVSCGHSRSDAAVPQARKASLARFLQKRKERVSNKTPYSFEKKSPDSSIVLQGAPTSSKFSSTDASNSSNRCGSWHAGQTKSCSGSDESLSTKLEM